MNAISRARGNIRAGSLTERANRGQGVISIDSVDFPPEVSPGGVVSLDFTIRNTQNSAICAPDPDSCISSTLGAGLRIEAQLRGSGRVLDSTERCVTCDGGTSTARLSFTAPPEEGTFSFEAVLVGSSTRNVLLEQRLSVEVTGEPNGGAEPPPDDGDDDSPFEGPLLPCFIDPNRSCDRTETIAWTLGALGVAAVVVGD